MKLSMNYFNSMMDFALARQTKPQRALAVACLVGIGAFALYFAAWSVCFFWLSPSHVFIHAFIGAIGCAIGAAIVNAAIVCLET